MTGSLASAATTAGSEASATTTGCVVTAPDAGVTR